MDDRAASGVYINDRRITAQDHIHIQGISWLSRRVAVLVFVVLCLAAYGFGTLLGDAIQLVGLR